MRFGKPAIPRYRTLYGILTDTNTGALLTMSPNNAALVLLHEWMPDVHRSSAVNYPDYPDPFFLASVPPPQYVEWSMGKSKEITRTRPDLVTPELRARSLLATSKVNALVEMMGLLSRTREKIATGVAHQDMVYILKRMQAQRFRDSGYDENLVLEIPFVVYYADLAGITLRAAADDILFMAKLDDDYLAKTETLRLRYFGQIRDVADPHDIPEIMRRFRVDCFSPQIT